MFFARHFRTKYLIKALEVAGGRFEFKVGQFCMLDGTMFVLEQ